MANDLDLDELHEAVSALMDQSKEKRAAKPAEPAAVLDPAENVTVKTAPPTVAPEPKSEPEPIADKIEVKRPLPNLSINRPRGRAMDVISPKPATPPPTKIKRQGVTLQPTQDVKPEPPKEIVKAEPETPKPESVPAEHARPETPALNYQKPAETEWPDPLDVHGFKDELEPKTDSAPTMTEDTQTKPDQIAQTSPFLNTKVEKRPLGAYSSEDAPIEVEPEETPQPEQQDNWSFGDLPQNQPDVRSEQQPEAPPIDSLDQTQETDLDEMRQATIPQQYKTTQKEHSSDSRPVFDTKDYHPPIQAAHAAHRSNSAMGWVLILVFALILIAALIFAFYMMTGSLDFSVLFK
ncbi:MAG TPA: hypothetical protein VLA77_02140 [Candidatus Saccharimonadales bacterium]|nr:hypothetical protein [Candidatus Saccharimonadales bacterium]